MKHTIIKQHYLNPDYFYVVLRLTKTKGFEIDYYIIKRPREPIIYQIITTAISKQKNQIQNTNSIQIYSNLQYFMQQLPNIHNLGIDDRIITAIKIQSRYSTTII